MCLHPCVLISEEVADLLAGKDTATQVKAELIVFFFNDTATTEIYTLSLHDALPISICGPGRGRARCSPTRRGWGSRAARDRKSTRLNSSHSQISYAVFCLKKQLTADRVPIGILALFAPLVLAEDVPSFFRALAHAVP